MASSLFSLVLVSLLITNLSYARCDLITEVCSNAYYQYKSLCYKTLNSDPRAAKADLKGLGFISIEISKEDVNSTYNYVVSLSEQAKGDPSVKDLYDTCVTTYNETIFQLDEAKKALARDDLSDFRFYVLAANEGPASCEDAFDGPLSAPPKLEKAYTKSQGLINIVWTIGTLLFKD